MSLPSRGLYISLKTIFPPAPEEDIFPHPTIRQNLLPTHLLGFCSSASNFNFPFIFSIFSVFLHSFLFFLLPLFILFPPKWRRPIYPPPREGGIFRYKEPSCQGKQFWTDDYNIFLLWTENRFILHGWMRNFKSDVPSEIDEKLKISKGVMQHL